MMNKTCTSNYLAKKVNLSHKELLTLIYLNPKLKQFLEPYSYQLPSGKYKSAYMYYKGDESILIESIKTIQQGGFIFGDDNI